MPVNFLKYLACVCVRVCDFWVRNLVKQWRSEAAEAIPHSGPVLQITAISHHHGNAKNVWKWDKKKWEGRGKNCEGYYWLLYELAK